MSSKQRSKYSDFINGLEGQARCRWIGNGLQTCTKAARYSVRRHMGSSPDCEFVLNSCSVAASQQLKKAAAFISPHKHNRGAAWRPLLCRGDAEQTEHLLEITRTAGCTYTHSHACAHAHTYLLVHLQLLEWRCNGWHDAAAFMFQKKLKCRERWRGVE